MGTVRARRCLATLRSAKIHAAPRAALFRRYFALAGRQNLDPLTLGVGDGIKAHARVLANNATHLFMKLVGGVKVVHDEGDMGVFATILVGLNASTVPGELDFEGHAVVAHERIGPRAIFEAHFAQQQVTAKTTEP